MILVTTPPFFHCHHDGPYDEEEAGRRCVQRRLDALGIRYKSAYVGSNGTLGLNLSGTRITDLSPLTELPLTHLCLQGCYGITDFSPLGVMRLSWLNLCRTKMMDLSVLSTLPLLHLDLRGTRTTDLLPMAGVPLSHLDIRFTGIRDLSPLGRTPLEEISLHPSRIQEGLGVLQGIRTLRIINRRSADEFWRTHSTEFSTRHRLTSCSSGAAH